MKNGYQIVVPVTRLTAALRALLVPALLLAAIPSPALGQGENATRQEYYRRLAAVSPRDAQEHYELSIWCSDSGLADEARALLERTIRIDPDHAPARLALGYRRHGLDWVIGGARRIPVTSPTDGGGTTAESTSSPTPPASTSTSSGDDTTRSSPASGATQVDPSPTFEELLEEKKAFAKKAGEQLRTAFNTKEDADFLVHTTHDLSSPQFRKLINTLKAVKKIVQSTTGAGSREPIWPDKVQFFFMRASSECVQFAEIVDGQRFPERDGWYTKDGHTVFYTIDPVVLGRLLGETALDYLGGSRRYVNWWLRIGLGEIVAAQAGDSPDSEIYRQAYLLAGSLLDGNASAFHIADLLGLPSMRGSETEGRAQALTLIDFLLRQGKRRLHRVIEDLKSDRSPPPPADFGDADAFRAFIVEYFAFEKQSMEKNFGDLDKLDQKWKEFIRQRAGSFAGGATAPGGQGPGRRPRGGN